MTNEIFLAAARALASEVTEADIAEGRIYPPLKADRSSVFNHRDPTAKIAYDQGLAAAPERDDLRSHIRAQMFEPVYRSYV